MACIAREDLDLRLAEIMVEACEYFNITIRTKSWWQFWR